MGWKNIKEHYRIGHIVAAYEGKGICIGSPYVHDLILISTHGEVKWGGLGPSGNEELARYYAEMTADPRKLKELIEKPDTFSDSLPVYTYDGGEIIEKFCEAYDWPNVTHDGCLMYENTYSPERDRVIKWAKRNAECGIQSIKELIADTEEDLKKHQGRLAEREADLAKLEAL